MVVVDSDHVPLMSSAAFVSKVSTTKGRTAQAASWLTLPILFLIMATAFSIRLYSVVRFESVIHEFDPWFNYRATRYVVEHGWRAFFGWIDDKVWYPLGRHVGRTVYPGMILVSALAHYVLNTVLAFPVELRNVCVFVGPVCSALTSAAAHLVAVECFPAGISGSVGTTTTAGLLAAAFTAIIPGYISRSVAGSFDYEAIAICQMLGTFWLWLVALRRRSAAVAVAAALAYCFMASSWGGYVFVANLVPLHALALWMLRGDGVYFAGTLYRVYCPFYVVALAGAMCVPFVSHQPIDTSEHMLALATFVFFQLLRVHYAVRDLRLSKRSLSVFYAAVGALVAVPLIAGIVATGGKIVPWAGRFYSLWDTGYARRHIPIIASVSEHQPTTWATFFLDMQLLTALFPLGLFLLLRDGWHHPRASEGVVFVALYALSATYFASVMVRLILTLAPIVCICAGVGAGRLVHSCFPGAGDHRIGRYNRILLGLPTLGVLALFLWHCVFVTRHAYSSPSIMLASVDPRTQRLHVIDDFREAYAWLRHNTPADSRVLAWWDYGYQLNGMADRTTIVDNNTWNNEHIALVGKIFASDERTAFALCRQLHVNYVLIWFGGLAGFSGDDLNKFLWMVRIAQGVFPDDVRESDFFNGNNEFRIDDQGSEALKRSLMYRLSYANMAALLADGPSGQFVDRVRRQAVSREAIERPLRHFSEVFSTENYLVRIFRVVD